jgi:hypothetical protein
VETTPRKISTLVQVATATAAALAVAGAMSQAPSLTAGGLLYPARHQSNVTAPGNCSDREFTGEGVILRGWHCRAAGMRRGTLIYLHGIADNRSSSVGLIQHFSAKGLDVVAYDSRRHGVSGGDVCTYGYLEKHDLRRVIDSRVFDALAGPKRLILVPGVGHNTSMSDPGVWTVTDKWVEDVFPR